ncbi:MAG: hypothetical protein ACRCT8_14960 [Lacipirellulaceae bacterium]
MASLSTDGSTLAAALGLAAPFFASAGALGVLTPVSATELPPEPRALLAHAVHMTETLERRHGCPVTVAVKGEDRHTSRYARHSLLARQSDGVVVQSGVMRIDLAGLPTLLAEAIVDGDAPLGRLLIENNVLRQVELLELWRIEAGPTLAEELSVPSGGVIYGRSARILVQGRPAVELLEIVTTEF